MRRLSRGEVAHEERLTRLRRLHLVPHVGRVPLAKLAPEHIQGLLRTLEAEGLSPTTRRYVRSVLRRALNQAERWGYVSRNAAALVEPPRVERADPYVLTPEDAGRLLEAVEGERVRPMIALAVSVGFRRGEVLGLLWDDVDLDSAQLRVTGTLRRPKHGGGLVRETPKTRSSVRTVPLPAFVVEELRRHRVTQLEERLAAGDVWQETGYVFTTEVGTPLDPGNLTRAFHRVRDRAGIDPRLTFHGLRHSSATLMLTKGVPL